MTTTGSGIQAHESVDGRTLFYTHRRLAGPAAVDELMAKPLDGQPERQLIENVGDHGVVVTDKGIYYLVSNVAQQMVTLNFYDLALGRSNEVLRYTKSAGTGLAVSPDRKTFLWSVSSQIGSDLMLIDNFR